MRTHRTLPLAALVVVFGCASSTGPLDQAREALARGDDDRAYAILDSVLSVGDPTAEGFSLMAVACVRTLRTARGAAAAARAITLAPNDLAAHRARACLEQRRMDNVVAVEEALEVVRLDPTNARHYALAGHLQLGGGRVGGAEYELAEESFRKALELAPDLPSARFGLARTLVEAGDADEALTLLDGLLGDGFATADVHYWRGRALARTHDFVGAEAAFRQALTIAPTLSAAAFNLARALRVNRENEESVAIQEEYTRILERDRYVAGAEFAFHSQPGAIAAALDLAPQLALAGRIDDALRVLDTACIDDPNRMDAHLLRAKVAGSALDWARAEEAVSRALDLAPEDADALGVAARIAFAREHYEDALRQADAARSKNADDVESALVSAYSLLKLGRPTEAVALLDPLARRVPGPRLLAALGEALLDVGSPEAAERVLTMALERRATSTALALRGRAFAAQSRWQPAKEDLLEAIDRDPNDPDPYDELSAVLTSGFEGEPVEEWQARAKAVRRQRDQLRCLRDAFATDPRDAATAHALVEMLRQAGLDEEAARVVDRMRSREMDPCRD